MKQKLLLKSLLLLCAFLVGGASSAWAADTYEKVTATSQLEAGEKYLIVYEGAGNNAAACGAISSTSTKYGLSISVTISNSTITIKDEAVVAFELGGSTNAWTFKNGSNYLTWSSGNSLNQKNSANTNNEKWTIAIDENGVATITNNADNTRKLKYNTASNSLRFACYTSGQKDVSLYKKAANTTPTCDAPTFSPAGGTYTSAQNVEISTTTEGATIYYTTDGTAPTTSSPTYSSAINVSATTTIKAIAVKTDYDNSPVASATFTILSQKTISEARTQATGAIYTQGVVTTISGKTAFIQDAEAAIAVYNSAANIEGVAVGDKINVQGTLGAYNGLLQVQNPTITKVSSGNTVTPETMTIAQALKSEKQGWYVKIIEGKVTAIDSKNVTIAQEDKTIVVRYNDTPEVAVNDVISLTGNLSCFGETKQIANPTLISGVSITIPESKLTTFCNADAINFSGSGVTAYTAKSDGYVVTLTPIADGIVPAKAGVILRADAAGEYAGKLTTGGSITGQNEMVGVLVDTPVYFNNTAMTGIGCFILQNGAFYKAGEMSAAKLKAGKAYLKTHTSIGQTHGNNAPLAIVFEGETTGITNTNCTNDTNVGVVYDLSGRRVAQPTKGLYIVNGRKMIIK